jgi:hypothetical protein
MLLGGVALSEEPISSQNVSIFSTEKNIPVEISPFFDREPKILCWDFKPINTIWVLENKKYNWSVEVRNNEWSVEPRINFWKLEPSETEWSLEEDGSCYDNSCDNC